MRPPSSSAFHLYVFAYDIVCDRRRRRLARLAVGVGARVQKSVFYAWMTPRMLRDFNRRLEMLIDPVHDSVFLIPACEHCRGQLRTLGHARVRSLPRFWLVA